MNSQFNLRLLSFVFILAFLLSSCAPQIVSTPSGAAVEAVPLSQPTPMPQRPIYAPGELVDYTAQTGDTLPSLAVRFNTSVDEIRQANPLPPNRRPPCRPACP